MSVEDTYFPRNYTLRVRDKLLLINKPMVMGIINSTPDSFHKDSRFQGITSILKAAEKHINEGAKIIDLGGYSSRPGAIDITIQEEISRTAPYIEVLRKEFPETLISIDTFRSEAAFEAINSGADIINDISGGSIDPKIWDVTAKFKVPYICMHMKGTPQTMMNHVNYESVFKDVSFYFSEKLTRLKDKGIHDVILDPGFGFSKTLDQNFEIFNHIPDFHVFMKPILIGISRKSMIYKTLETDAENALNGTSVLNTLAILKGAAFLRVHDVKEAVEVVKLTGYLKQNE
jgi:dihydropteroate synthase